MSSNAGLVGRCCVAPNPWHLLRRRLGVSQRSRVLLVQRLRAHTRPPGDLRPGVAGLAEPADLVGLAEVGHLAEGADASEGQLGVVFEAERTVGVAGC